MFKDFISRTRTSVPRTRTGPDCQGQELHFGPGHHWISCG